jgi:F1F0 ATPase subunit 2
MNEALVLAPACIAGGVLGMIFFGGLWWTVRKGLTSKHPALWFLGSLLARTCCTLAGFYLVSGNRWERMAACLTGFILARVAVIRLTRTTEHREASHAP